MPTNEFSSFKINFICKIILKIKKTISIEIEFMLQLETSWFLDYFEKLN